jgi:hypothetical protein
VEATQAKEGEEMTKSCQEECEKLIDTEDALMGCIVQACWNEEAQEFDSYCMSSYEDAFKILIKAGRLKRGMGPRYAEYNTNE